MSHSQDAGGDPADLQRHYSGANVTEYDARRRDSPKWRFEEDALRRVLQRHAGLVRSIVDAPVGTGRFFALYEAEAPGARVRGLDLSDDMLTAARRNDLTDRVALYKHDLLRDPIVPAADLVVCCRFLNLASWADAQRTLIHLFEAARRSIALAIRLVDDGYAGEPIVERKIHLHRRSDFKRFCQEHDVAIAHVDCLAEGEEGNTTYPGDYCIVECVPRRVWKSMRFNKNQRAIYVYGRSTEQGKVYEVKDAAHAAFVRSITGDSVLAPHFPAVLAVDGNFLDVEWCPGTLVPATAWQQPLELLIAIQSLPSSADSSFDYVEDLVIPRFRKALPVVGRNTFERVVSAIHDLLPPGAPRVSHPDVIPGNVVATRDGTLVLIDNELLCRSRHYRVDILNMLQNLPPADRAATLAAYLRLSGISLDAWESAAPYLTHLWLARQVGSDVVTGAAGRMRERLRAFEAGENVLPYDPGKLRLAL